MVSAGTSYRAIFKLSLPIVISLLADQLLITTDAIFVGRLGTLQLSAVGYAGLVYYAFILVSVGLSMGAQIIFARRNGEGKYEEAGEVLDNALLLFLGIGVILFLSLRLLSAPIMKLVIQDVALRELCVDYLTTRSYGTLFISVAFALRAFFIGITRTNIILVASLVAALLNVGLDYVLIFGAWGFPRLEVYGSAIASSTAEFTMAVLLIFSVTRRRYSYFQHFTFRSLKWSRILNILKVGGPLMLQSWIAVNAWMLYFSWIETLSTQYLAASMVLKNLYVLYMLPVWAFGSACASLISNAIGEGKVKEAKKIMLRSIVLALALITPFLLLTAIFSEPALLLFTDNLALVKLAQSVLWLMLLSAFLYGIAHPVFAAVAGYGATVAALVIEVANALGYLLLCYWLTHAPSATLSTIWIAEPAYMLGLLLLSAGVVWRVKRKGVAL